jgi:hypothetical protein
MTIYRAVPGVLAEDVGGKTLVIDAASSELVTLNQVGSMVWSAIAERPRSVDDVVGELSVTFTGVSRERLAADVGAFLDDLVAAGLAVAG